MKKNKNTISKTLEKCYNKKCLFHIKECKFKEECQDYIAPTNGDFIRNKNNKELAYDRIVSLKLNGKEYFYTIDTERFFNSLDEAMASEKEFLNKKF